MTSSVTRTDASAQAADIPSLDRLLKIVSIQPLFAEYGRTQVLTVLREHLASLRDLALAGQLQPHALLVDAIVGALGQRLRAIAQPKLRTVFNLTGTVLHTNLGRALLPECAIQAVMQAMAAPTNLEFNLDTGARGDRDDLIENLLCELTGAEAATVVNNNAAAVLLMLNALSNRREVVVSRGELVEIGGAFRIPDIMQRAGARLVEVGTTNRTHVADYENAVGARTSMLMKVHCSNYAVTGFTKSVNLPEMADVARRHGLPATVDLGSGTLLDMTQWGLPYETTVQENIQQGADIVTFSGDKLLGGPQAGLLVGRADLIKKIKRNPLKRALRVGKLTLAALEPVLALYRAPEHLAERLTTLRLLTRPQNAMQQQALRLLPFLQQWLGTTYQVTAQPTFSQIGSGAMPVNLLPSYSLRAKYAGPGRSGRHLVTLQTRLRNLAKPVIGRVSDDALWLDLRCLPESDETAFIAQLTEPQA